ncbi:type II toxin-antitoxin system prevent-host-death family antitoxin [Paenarthrobacter sp. PH39-S1]|uniref:type II toxin-antitoxin system prevent-host-death family antitoxin n=1 Tax=Paenarthrobacter sp. PH39-S1 TaxID=3046204 RepID=UPI0024BA818D|nr:type II toxin-antitoxin system prevent-host-death family antitoxin [Paenarthrobacter sp. PH39-S1]MDJ0355429.1 type II toxin-antitoxin system prevent-host-death family antitoxin [Paenarthrobacter sp. PH39-S1]
MSTILPRRVFQSSELSRQPAPLFSAAEESPIEVTRRGGDALVLMSVKENDARDRLLELAAQIIAITVDDAGRSLGDRFADRFDWMLALDAQDREVCARDLLRSARASFSTGRAHLAITEMAMWRSTATAIAEGLHSRELTWFDQPVPISRP